MRLADALHRVPWQPGLHVLHRRGAGHAAWLTSQRLILEPGGTAHHSSALEETIVVLQEVYHFRVDSPHGCAHQELYTTAGEVAIHRVRDGDAVLLPYGYHPVSAPPGYRLYYLWALAGEHRVLKPYEDPEHRWSHDGAPECTLEQEGP
jgi:hypothetical protein